MFPRQIDRYYKAFVPIRSVQRVSAHLSRPIAFRTWEASHFDPSFFGHVYDRNIYLLHLVNLVYLAVEQ